MRRKVNEYNSLYIKAKVRTSMGVELVRVFKKLPGDKNYCRGVETIVEIAFCHVGV